MSASPPVLFDSHCHLQDVADPAATWERARAAGIGGAVCIGADVGTSRRALALAAALGGAVVATAGLHPHEAVRRGDEGVEGIAALVREADVRPDGPAFVAIGECGLDYHYDHSPRADQREAFAEQVALAIESRRTLVVHTREAWDDTLSILRSVGVPDRVVFHCFTGGPDEARRCLDLGSWLSFSGIVTFPNAGELREAAALCPPRQLLVETDSPFLTPVPLRGRPNEPANVRLVASAVASAKGSTVEELAPVLWSNTEAAFALR